MTLIKIYFVGTLKALAADVQRRIADKVLLILIFIVH